MNCYVREGTIYDHRGNQLQPDDNGIIVLENRKFVKDKLANWLAKNNQFIPPAKIKVIAPIENKSKKQRPKKYTIHKVRKIRTDYTRKGIEVFAEKDGVTYGPFISLTKCSQSIGVSKSQISKILKGQSTTTTGFKFDTLT